MQNQALVDNFEKNVEQERYEIDNDLWDYTRRKIEKGEAENINPFVREAMERHKYDFPLLSLLPRVATQEKTPYIAVRRGVTHMVQSMEKRFGINTRDIIKEETEYGISELFEKSERQLFVGENGIMSQIAYHRAYHKVIDWRDYADFSMFDIAAKQLRTQGLKNFSNIQAIIPVNTLMVLSALAQKQHYGLSAGISPRMFNPVHGKTTNFGDIPFKKSLFLENVDGGKPVNTSGYDSKIYFNVLIPTPLDVNIRVSNSMISYFNYIHECTYWIATFNKNGESDAVVAGTVIVPRGNAVNIEVDIPENVDGIRVYRNDNGEGIDKSNWIATCRKKPNQKKVFLYDYNGTLPNTDTALVWNNVRETIYVKQSLDIVKLPLLVSSTTTEFILPFFHEIVVEPQGHIVLIKNIKRESL